MTNILNPDCPLCAVHRLACWELVAALKIKGSRPADPDERRLHRDTLKQAHRSYYESTRPETLTEERNRVLNGIRSLNDSMTDADAIRYADNYLNHTPHARRTARCEKCGGYVPHLRTSDNIRGLIR